MYIRIVEITAPTKLQLNIFLDYLKVTHFPKNLEQGQMNAKVFKSDSLISDNHFNKRDLSKNALAISSYQSKEIKSYDDVQKKYDTVLQDKCINLKRPEYWGGYSFTPYYFEFWEGDDSRINKRKVYEIEGREWVKYYLQP